VALCFIRELYTVMMCLWFVDCDLGPLRCLICLFILEGRW
jgi:hypothetical protein